MGGGHGQDTRAGALWLYVGVGRNQPSRQKKSRVPLLGRRLRRWSKANALKSISILGMREGLSPSNRSSEQRPGRSGVSSLP